MPGTPSSPKSTNVRANSRAKKSTNVRSPVLRAVRAGLGALAWISEPAALSLASRLFFATQRHRPRPGERDVLAGARRESLARGRATLRGFSWGRAGAPRMLLVHGWNGRATQLGSFVAPLTARGFQVLAFDLGAHGDSDATRPEGHGASLVSLAEDLLAIDGRYGPFGAAIAHSVGGPVTALAHIAGLRAERLAFVSPPLEAEPWFCQFAELVGFDGPRRARFRSRIERQVGVGLQEISGLEVAPHMRTPLLVVHDEDDREVAISDGVALAAAWPGAVLERTRGLGHQRILRDAHVIDVVVRFVTHDPKEKAA